MSVLTPGTFADLGLDPALCRTLAELGFTEPTPIQAEAIPPLLAGRDVLGQAATGTGKTAAYALPMLHASSGGRANAPVGLVLVPTRELAIQVADAIESFGTHSGLRVVAVYGGAPIGRQLSQLDRGAHIVVATPGRAIDHIKRGSLALDQIETVVLDEADEMLDMGFSEDLETILDATPEVRQTVLLSATMPRRIADIAARYQHDPIRITIARPVNDDHTAAIEQRAYLVGRPHKAAALGRILDVESPTVNWAASLGDDGTPALAAIVFCRTRGDVDSLTETMNASGYRAEALHGGMDQPQRDRVMGRLREGTAQLLIATDVAARGLDVDLLTHVINYDVPTAAESYVHRIGRVGRAGRRGVAITLVEPRDRRQLGNIERITKQRITIAPVPSVADLDAKRREQTVGLVAQYLERDDLDGYHSLLAELTAVADLREIALAALALVHQASIGPGDRVEIPEIRTERRERRDYDRAGRDRFEGRDRNRRDRYDRSDRGEPSGRRHRSDTRPTASVFVGLGRKAGLRPGDLVGAIANEAGLSGREIGPIRISDHYSVVGVPESSLDQVIRSVHNTTIRGKRAKVRPYVEDSAPRPRERSVR